MLVRGIEFNNPCEPSARVVIKVVTRTKCRDDFELRLLSLAVDILLPIGNKIDEFEVVQVRPIKIAPDG